MPQPLQWRHDEHDGISNHQCFNCLLNWFFFFFFRRRSMKNIKAPHQWPLWEESTGDQWFPSQRASNPENDLIWWCHHDSHVLLWLYNEMQRSSGWQPWYSLTMLKLVFNVSSEYLGCHPDDLSISLYYISNSKRVHEVYQQRHRPYNCSKDSEVILTDMGELNLFNHKKTQQKRSSIW